MDTTTAHALIALNNKFYAEHAESFSATRSAPWEGWKRLAKLLPQNTWNDVYLNDAMHSNKDSCSNADVCVNKGVHVNDGMHVNDDVRSVLDLACGNLRFEHFLAEEFPHITLDVHAVDSCAVLSNNAQSNAYHLTFYEIDVLERALKKQPILGNVPACDLSACFGFMHHVPGFELRQTILNELLDHTLPGGMIAISFWQFMQDEKLARKAQYADELAQSNTQSGESSHGSTHHANELAQNSTQTLDVNLSQLEPGDHFLGWQQDPSPLRYCHHFTEAEIDELVASVGTQAHELARYSADGASGTLNRYLILEKL